MWNFLKEYVAQGSILCTDGFSIYDRIEKLYPVTHIIDIISENLENIVSEFAFRFSHPEIYENPRVFLQITLHLVPTG
ncbi:MAG: hypothetical protein UT61_C0047G0004 [Candidatus Woesebacteria bacterium GW2011_GWA1_39_8]|uniref:ISXO2-like transposase domain-containing protein n=1 Tax=Candidatus Woesebacteria bacterium GW2011_GWA1_39_8 TaxID=1618552 RepID=A0A0G0S1F6_9BACT|nr:MAG: hypothetical protein UT61_C0047G0004 [Candidatus Woesebacteria bacterium GW2011_GWA1_39_8]